MSPRRTSSSWTHAWAGAPSTAMSAGSPSDACEKSNATTSVGPPARTYAGWLWRFRTMTLKIASSNANGFSPPP